MSDVVDMNIVPKAEDPVIFESEFDRPGYRYVLALYLYGSKKSGCTPQLIPKALLISLLHKTTRHDLCRVTKILVRGFYDALIKLDKAGRKAMQGSLTNLNNRLLITMLEENVVLWMDNGQREEFRRLQRQLCSLSEDSCFEEARDVALRIVELGHLKFRTRLGSVLSAVFAPDSEWPAGVPVLQSAMDEKTQKLMENFAKHAPTDKRKETSWRNAPTGKNQTVNPKLPKAKLSQLCAVVAGMNPETGAFWASLLDDGCKAVDCQEFRKMVVLASMVDHMIPDHLKGNYDEELLMQKGALSPLLPRLKEESWTPELFIFLVDELGANDRHVSGPSAAGMNIFLCRGIEVHPEPPFKFTIGKLSYSFDDLKQVYLLTRKAQWKLSEKESPDEIVDAMVEKKSHKRPREAGPRQNWSVTVLRNIRPKKEFPTQVAVVYDDAMRACDVPDAAWKSCRKLTLSLLLVLVFRRMIATKDTNLFNLMVKSEIPMRLKERTWTPALEEALRGCKAVLSVDENRIPERDLAKKWTEGDPSTDLIAWLTTAQPLRVGVRDALKAVAESSEGKETVRHMLEKFRLAYECQASYQRKLHGDFSEETRNAILDMHNRAYLFWGVPPPLATLTGNAEDQASNSPEEWQRSWRKEVDQFLTPEGQLDARVLFGPMSSRGCGFKNLSLVTHLHDPEDAGNSIPAFVKIGESREDSVFHQHVTTLRRLIGLAAVPVTLVDTLPESLQLVTADIQSAVDAGMEAHRHA